MRSFAEKSVTRPARSWAQLVSGVVGVLLLVMGILVLVDTGLKFDPVAQTELLGMVHTSWMAVVEIVLGLFALAAAGSAFNRSSGIVTGIAMFVIGLVLAVSPEAADSKFTGGETELAVVILVLGVILAASASFAPIVRERTDVVDSERV